MNTKTAELSESSRRIADGMSQAIFAFSFGMTRLKYQLFRELCALIDGSDLFDEAAAEIAKESVRASLREGSEVAGVLVDQLAGATGEERHAFVQLLAEAGRQGEEAGVEGATVPEGTPVPPASEDELLAAVRAAAAGYAPGSFAAAEAAREKIAEDDAGRLEGMAARARAANNPELGELLAEAARRVRGAASLRREQAQQADQQAAEAEEAPAAASAEEVKAAAAEGAREGAAEAAAEAAASPGVLRRAWGGVVGAAVWTGGIAAAAAAGVWGGVSYVARKAWGGLTAAGRYLRDNPGRAAWAAAKAVFYAVGAALAVAGLWFLAMVVGYDLAPSAAAAEAAGAADAAYGAAEAAAA